MKKSLIILQFLLILQLIHCQDTSSTSTVSITACDTENRPEICPTNYEPVCGLREDGDH